MPIILNPKLYNKAKQIADETYSKPSAYKSGFIVKTYKKLGGSYADNKEPKSLERWFEEQWKDIGGKEYPTYRPTKRISKDTPLTVDEIDPKNLQDQIELKQKIKGDTNLPPFIKGDGLSDFSNISVVQKMADKYDVGKVLPSTKKDKKFMVESPDGKLIHFGQLGFQDFTKHNDEKKRTAFRNRNHKWANNPKYSASWLAYHLLW